MWVLCIVIVSIQAFLLSGSKNVLRIYNGVDDHTSRHPYVVALKPEIDPVHYEPRLSTGSLIAENWVISSAECLSNMVKYIQYGNLSLPLSITDDKSQVLKMFKHPRCFPASYVNNIGLALVKSVPMAKYGRLSAVDYITMIGYPVEYAGFGMTFIPKQKDRNKKETMKTDYKRPLQLGEGVIKSCSEPFGRNFICLSSKCSHNQLILHGDSGAPMFCEGKIIEIACAYVLDHNEQIFTPISPYLTWIHQVITIEGQ